MSSTTGVHPTEQEIMDMQKRIGIRQDVSDYDEALEHMIEDLRDIVRLQPKRSQKLLGMTKEDYEMFGVEPSENLDDLVTDLGV